MLVALGGMFSRAPGVINIALEGIMVVGGLIGVRMINIMNAAGVPIALALPPHHRDFSAGAIYSFCWPSRPST